MQLLIDLGNTRLKWALLDDGTMAARGAFEHGGNAIVPALERDAVLADARIGRIVVASVAPLALDVDLETFVRQRFGIEPEFLSSPAAALGVRNAYAEPARLGIDRFLALVAAHASCARAQVLVGVGTASTLDALAEDGTHLGGWILPSPALMRHAIATRTARVGDVEGRLVDFADTTADALHSGILNATLAAIERFRANAARHLGTLPALLLSGGGADQIAALLPDAERRADLILDGLAAWANATGSPEFAVVRR